MSLSNSRKGIGRAPLPRRTTRGPLDIEDPLSDSSSLPVSPGEPASPSLGLSSEFDAPLITQTTPEIRPSSVVPGSSKDFAFLLDASVYHPLSNIEVPAPFKHPLPQLPPANTSLSQMLSDLDGLLAQCHFLSAAHLAATILTSGFVRPTDDEVIFRLLSIRYSSLELSGNVLLAGQEARALEDLSSTFYYVESTPAELIANTEEQQPSVLKHVMPFDLRLQALRLQGIGFSDSRRTISALFDLGMECRDNLTSGSSDTKELWEARLKEVGVRVVNSLIDMGDLDCARRTLNSMVLEQEHSGSTWSTRLLLLLIKMGEINEARSFLNSQKLVDPRSKILSSFLEIAEGNYDKATDILSEAIESSADDAVIAIAKQNLAVAYLYTGDIERSRQILESLVGEGHSFQALTVNLATLYDLKSDKSKDLKTSLAMKIAQTSSSKPQRAFANADFKL